METPKLKVTIGSTKIDSEAQPDESNNSNDQADKQCNTKPIETTATPKITTIADLPKDILAEIASHILPSDIDLTIKSSDTVQQISNQADNLHMSIDIMGLSI